MIKVGIVGYGNLGKGVESYCAKPGLGTCCRIYTA